MGTLRVPVLTDVARFRDADCSSIICSRTIVALMISAESLHGDPNPYAVGSFQGVRSWEILTLRQLELHQDEGV